MRILVCASEAPLAPLNGMRLQLYELTRCLAARHEVCVLAVRWPEQGGDPPPGVELLPVAPPPASAGRRVVGWATALVRRQPVDAIKLEHLMLPRIAALRTERRFDVAHVSLGSLAGVAPALDGIPAIVAPLDAWPLNVHAQVELTRGPRRQALRVHERLVRRFVARAYRPYGRVVLVSTADADETRRLDPTLRTAVVPNGVDTRHFRPDARTEREPGRIVFTGALHAPSNERAARMLADEILPAVRVAHPGARLALVGRAPGATIRALTDRPGVEVVGDVPDLRPWLWRSEVFACAMTSGTGIKNKLLEALACGVPSVATPLACQGLDVRDGAELLIADAGPPFARAVAGLLADPARRDALAAAGRRYVEARHSWEATAAAYEELYLEASSPGASPDVA